MALALKKRLQEYESVDTAVSCDAMGLLDGRFNSMCIEGRHWHTPLNMTAHKLEVRTTRAVWTLCVSPQESPTRPSRP